jgi:GNAT superfamily N-acetyltransferase
MDSDQLRLEIRGADPDHWSDIRSLHAQAFRRLACPALEPRECQAFVDHIYAADYTAALQMQDIQVAWYEGRIIGTAGWMPSDDRGTAARITSVFVSPLFARIGVGRRLVTAAEARARTAGFRTFVARAFQPSAGFFESLGYVRSSQGVQTVGTENGIPVAFMRKQEAEGDHPDRDSEDVAPPANTVSS